MHNVVLQEQMDDLRETTGVSFKDAYITADIRKDFTQADFRGARLQDIKIKDAIFTECDFSEATIRADITNAKFIRCNFKGATFQHAYIYESAFIENDFQESQFLRLSIRKTELSKNNFVIAKMADVIMSDTTVREANINTHTIRYDFPGATKEELERMRAACVEQLDAYVEDVIRKVNNATWAFMAKTEENLSDWKIGHINDTQIKEMFETGNTEQLEFALNEMGEYVLTGEAEKLRLEALDSVRDTLLMLGKRIIIHNINENTYEAAIEEALADIEPLEPEFEPEM